MTDLPSGLAIERGEETARELEFPRPSRLAVIGLIVAFLAWVVLVALSEPIGRAWGSGLDARSYWLPRLTDPYANANWTTVAAYVYSPAFLQLVAPIASLAWQPFFAVWTVLLLAALRFLTGPRLFLFGIAFSTLELIGGNISLLLAVAMVVGFRYPAAWSFVLLTKITPGIGLLWFVVRREWRNLGIALGATGLVILISGLLMPTAWVEWFGVLSNIAGREGTWAAVPIPFAVALVVWGARTDRRWTVPVAGMLALPALWYGGLTMLLAVIALRQPVSTTSSGGDGTRVPSGARAAAS
jgi:hypothetical protein